MSTEQANQILHSNEKLPLHKKKGLGSSLEIKKKYKQIFIMYVFIMERICHTPKNHANPSSNFFLFFFFKLRKSTFMARESVAAMLFYDVLKFKGDNSIRLPSFCLYSKSNVFCNN